MKTEKEFSAKIVGAQIIDVEEVDLGEDTKEWLAYEIAIHTNRSILRITGCHDNGPDFEWTDNNVGPTFNGIPLSGIKAINIGERLLLSKEEKR